MFSKTVQIINNPSCQTTSVQSGTNKGSTACTVNTCKAPSSGNCVVQ